MLVIADTSALLALTACDSLMLLDVLFQEVRVPHAVYLECIVTDKPGADRLTDYLRGRTADIDLSEFVVAAVGLGRGELEAMALYKHLKADRLLIDDSRARRVAKLNEIEVIGSIGVLLLAKSMGEISALRPLLNAIRSAGIYLSDQVVAEALSIANEAEDS